MNATVLAVTSVSTITASADIVTVRKRTILSKIKEIITRTFQGWFGMQTTLLIGINDFNQTIDTKGFPKLTAIA